MDEEKYEEYVEDSEDDKELLDADVYEEPDIELGSDSEEGDSQSSIEEYDDSDSEYGKPSGKIKYRRVEEEHPEIIKAGFDEDSDGFSAQLEEAFYAQGDQVSKRAKDQPSSSGVSDNSKRESRPIYEPPFEDEPALEGRKSIREHLESGMTAIPRDRILRKPITMNSNSSQSSSQSNDSSSARKDFQNTPTFGGKKPFEKPRDPVTDSELKQIIAEHRSKILVVGCGGAGNNTLNRMSEVGMGDVQTIAVNTDAQDLLQTMADKKILIGKLLTKGLGAGAIPKVGEDAAKEADAEIKAALQNSDLVFITCGMGGGTGTGSAPVIADIARKMGILTVGIVTMPFTMEGARRRENARIGLEKMQQFVDTLIVIPNDKLLILSPDLPLHTAFKLADEILTNAVRGIANLIIEPGLVNLDFADVKTVMSNAGIALIGVGESDTDQRAVEAVDKALNNPLLEADIAGAGGALINISGGPDMTLEEARFVVEEVSSKLDDDARIIWGAQISDDLQSTIRVLLIITGVKTKQVATAAGRDAIAQRRKKEIENELGIEFV